MLSLLSISAFALPDLSEPVRTSARANEDAAVVIGIEDYFQLPDVPGAVADAKLIVELLAHTRGIPRSRIRVLTSGASREQILAAVDEVAVLAAGGHAWLYFAGHGAASPSTGERLLLGDDARPDLAVFEPRAVPVAEVSQRLTGSGARAVLLLDTCYTGVDRSGEAVFDKRFALPTAMLDTGPQALIWTATTPGEWSGVLPGSGHGAFTWAVAGALRGWADTDADGSVDAAEASAWVAEALLTLQVRDQHPVMEGSDPASWILVSGDLQPAPELRPEGPEIGSADYVDTLAAMATQQAALKAAHQERTAHAVAQAQSAAAAEWDRIATLKDTDETTALAGIDAFIARWQGHTVEVDGVAEPAPIPQLTEAQDLGRKLRLALAMPGHGLVPPVLPSRDNPGRFVDGAGTEFRSRDLYPLASALSPRCAEEVVAQRRSKTAGIAFWSTMIGSAALGATLVAADPQLTTAPNAAGENQVTNIGPLGIVGFSVMGGGMLGSLAIPYAMLGGIDGSDEGFAACVEAATE